MRLDRWLLLRRETLTAPPPDTAAPPAGGAPAPAEPAAPAPSSEPAPAPTPAPAPASSWRDALPESYERKGPDGKAVKVPLRAAKSLEKFTDPNSLAMGYIELERQQGAAVKIPPPDATPEQRRAFYDALGVPKDVGGYGEVKLPEVEGGAAGDTAALEQVKAIALAEGIPPAALQKLVNFAFEREVRARDRLIESWDPQMQALEQEWGANYERNLGLARDGLAYAFGPGWEESAFGRVFQASGIDRHPEAFKAFAKIGARLSEHDVIRPRATPGTSKSDAQTRLAAILADPAYRNHRLPSHDALVEEAYALQQILHPEPL